MKPWKNLCSIILAIIFLVMFSSMALAVDVDKKLIDLTLDKFEEFDPEIKAKAISFLESYFGGSATLNLLKTDLPMLLSFTLGEDYLEKLENRGLSLEQIRDEVDKLKVWSMEDRDKMIAFLETRNSEGIAQLIEKYKGVEYIPGAGDGSKEKQDVEGDSEPPKTSFKDIENHWAAPYIKFAKNFDIIHGKTPSVFAPEDKITRAEFTAMLVRLLRIEATVHRELPFTDVAAGDWFFDVIRSGFAAGIIEGKGEQFAPGDSITREEMMVLIVRSVSLKGKAALVDSLEIAELLSNYIDQDQLSSWSKKEAAIALKLGLIRGKGQDTLEPKAHATRAEAATMIFNLYHLLNE